jgi:hypothetical protein
MDDMKSTQGFYEGAYTCWVAIMLIPEVNLVQNPKVNFLYFDNFEFIAGKKRFSSKNLDK